tara:strand:+ start:184 stop:618 length:435 start_codon:yes stop_codon:yes gene_type:complete
MKKILILNGPNLNMLGKRDPKQYGSMTLADIEALCRDVAAEYDFEIDFRQSNHEGELVEWIQQALGKCDALMINAGAYTHTSLAIRDALELLEVPIIEVHLSDPKTREEFRHFSYIERLATATISGQKDQSYVLALKKLGEILN